MADTVDALLDALKSDSIKLDDYLESASELFVNPDIKSFWTSLIDKSKISKSYIAVESGINYKYFYDVIKGRKVPKRDKVIRLCLTMKSGIDDCQAALKISGKSQLDPRIRRDSIILYALTRGWSKGKCCGELALHNEEELK